MQLVGLISWSTKEEMNRIIAFLAHQTTADARLRYLSMGSLENFPKIICFTEWLHGAMEHVRCAVNHI